MKKIIQKLGDFIQEKKTSLIISTVLLVLSGLCVWIYYSPSTFLFHNHFIPHFSAVFFEIALGVLIVEEVIKSKREQEKQKEKRTFFMSKMKDKKIDTHLLEFLQKTEQLIQLLPNYRKQNIVFEKYKDSEIRFRIFEKHAFHFNHTNNIEDFLQEKKFQNQNIQNIISQKTEFTKKFSVLLQEWETKFQDIIESISLTSYPHTTKYSSWDHVVGLHIQIQKLLRQEDFFPVHTQEEKILQKNNMFLSIYIISMKAYCLLMMDYKYDFHVQKIPSVHDFSFIKKLNTFLEKNTSKNNA